MECIDNQGIDVADNVFVVITGITHPNIVISNVGSSGNSQSGTIVRSALAPVV
jgi:hypothetical protein